MAAPKARTKGLNQNRKTNPEQTLSVPVVFCNRLKFSEFVKEAEIIWQTAAATTDPSALSPHIGDH
ncbi:hypothetical protein [Mesorhizobium loti]|uniref:hypothetical protein n=1 Tax=Rhizobium loti TaxID=381 RepID=UPI0012BD325B|nr:hypothetical protein [Mesorhizobium loti]